MQDDKKHGRSVLFVCPITGRTINVDVQSLLNYI